MSFMGNLAKYKAAKASKKIAKKIWKFIWPHFLWIIGIGFLIIILAAIASVLGQQNTQQLEKSLASYPPEVEQYRSYVQEQAGELHIEPYVNITMAIINEEARLNPLDVMAASNSTYNTDSPGGITYPPYSIWCGMRDLRDIIELLGKAASGQKDYYAFLLTSYHLGIDYVRYALDNGGHSVAVAQKYIKAKKLTGKKADYGEQIVADMTLQSGDADSDKTKSDSGGNNGNTTGNGYISYPLKNYKRISSPFGPRVHPISGKKSFHGGVDFPAPQGTSIGAVAAGKVVTAGYMGGATGYGNYIVIQHNSRHKTLYAHCHKLLKRVGQQVSQGDIIAQVGSTGASTGNHLHFEVRVDGTRVDPAPYLKQQKKIS